MGWPAAQRSRYGETPTPNPSLAGRGIERRCLGQACGLQTSTPAFAGSLRRSRPGGPVQPAPLPGREGLGVGWPAAERSRYGETPTPNPSPAGRGIGRRCLDKACGLPTSIPASAGSLRRSRPGGLVQPAPLPGREGLGVGWPAAERSRYGETPTPNPSPAGRGIERHCLGEACGLPTSTPASSRALGTDPGSFLPSRFKLVENRRRGSVSVWDHPSTHHLDDPVGSSGRTGGLREGPAFAGVTKLGCPGDRRVASRFAATIP